MVKLTKVVEPKGLAERSQAVGWCIGSLLNRFEKTLYRVKSLTVNNTGNKVTAMAVVCVNGTTFEDDHVAWLDDMIETLVTVPTPSKGYCWTRLYWSWDTAERISEVVKRVWMSDDGD